MMDGVPIRSVSRTISVLKLINRHGSLPMHRISRGTGLSYQTAWRIVHTLVHEGLVEFEPIRRHYRPTSAVQELAIGYQPHNALTQIARPFLNRLTKEFHWPVGISSRVGMNMVLRDSTHAETTLTFENYPPGYTFPLYNSASGLLCLAYSGAGSVEELAQGVQGREDADQVLLATYDSAVLAKVRDQGFAILAGKDDAPGRTGGISVPIFLSGEFQAALTLVYFATVLSQREASALFVLKLKDAARHISQALEGVQH